MIHQGLVHQWRERLEACRQQLAAGRTSFPWLYQVQAHVLRFLLARFGSGPGSWSLPEQGERPSRMAFRAGALPEKPAPAKSPERIRSTLDSVHDAAADLAKPGPLAAGIPADHLVTVACFSNYQRAYRFQKLLEEEGVESCRIPHTRGISVQVAARHLSTGKRIIQQHDLKTGRGERGPNLERWAVLGMVLGLMLGVPTAVLIAVTTESAGPLLLTIPAMCLLGTIASLLLACVIRTWMDRRA